MFFSQGGIFKLSRSEANQPSLIACKTKIGFGSPSREGKSSSHGAPLGSDDINEMKKFFNWNNFDIIRGIFGSE